MINSTKFVTLLGIGLMLNTCITDATLLPKQKNKTSCLFIPDISKVILATVHNQSMHVSTGNVQASKVKSLNLMFLNFKCF